MKTLNQHHNSIKGNSKKDYHTKKMFNNNNEPMSNFAIKSGTNRLKPTKKYYKLNQYYNWWEGVESKGDGKLLQELDDEIKVGIEEYEVN